MKLNRVIRKTLLFSGVFLTILLMVSSATALQVVNKNGLKKEKIVEKCETFENFDRGQFESLEKFLDSEEFNSELEIFLSRINNRLDENKEINLATLKNIIIQISQKIKDNEIESLTDLKEVEPCGVIGVAIGLLTWPLAILFFGGLEIITFILWVIIEIVGTIIATILLPWINLFPMLISLSDFIFGLSWLYIQIMLYWPDFVGTFIPF